MAVDNEIYIKIKVGKKEIEYRQTIERSTCFAATSKENYSKANSNETLIKTIESMCKELKQL